MKYIVIILFSVCIFISCKDRSEMLAYKPNSLQNEEQADQIANDVVVIFADSSITKAILKSKQARIFNKIHTTFLDSMVNVVFLSRFTQKRMSILTSDSARIDDLSKDMIAMGNVVVISDSNNVRLETEVLNWDNSKQKIFSKEFVKINTKNELITGYGFESNPDLSNYKIFKVSGIQRAR
ncbi:MAG TPA: LPS export ABC transporter periplasmic protein LptC [Candidatus Kapabacteria bacterium]|nr:LPS export ABC transporter periplasmic protein LptC [Candidatus Kapabacteria bacterium]